MEIIGLLRSRGRGNQRTANGDLVLKASAYNYWLTFKYDLILFDIFYLTLLLIPCILKRKSPNE